MPTHAEPHAVDEIHVHVHRPSPDIDDRSPIALAGRMGTLTRVMMLVFGLGPVFLGMLALGVAWEGGPSWLVGATAFGWLANPLVVAFYLAAGVGLYGLLIFQDRALDTLGKAFWFFSVLFAGPLAIPAYWWSHVWKAPRLSEPMA